MQDSATRIDHYEPLLKYNNYTDSIFTVLVQSSLFFT